MVQVLVAFINTFLLYVILYAAVKRLSANNSDAVAKLTAVVLLFTILSFLTYLRLTIYQDLTRLLILMTVINIPLTYIFRTYFFDAITFNGIRQGTKSMFWALLGVLFLTAYFFLFASKYGGWDAWAMWNLKAKFLFYPAQWKSMFHQRLAYSSRDYPLMLPGTVGFFWSALNYITPYVPMVFSYLVLILVPLLVYYALLNEGAGFLACIALVVFVNDKTYKELAIVQQADTLLSLFFLLVFVQYSSLKKNADNNIYLLAFICASCGWVKNEGIVFSLLFSLCFVIKNIKAPLALIKYGAGFIIPGLVTVSFKWFYSPANSIVANQHGVSSFKANFLAVDKYAVIAKAAVDMLFNNYLLLIILFVLIIIYNARVLISLPLVVIYLLLGAYFIAYLAAPGDLNWLLTTSVARLWEHVFPALIFLLFSGLKNIGIKTPPNLKTASVN